MKNKFELNADISVSSYNEINVDNNILVTSIADANKVFNNMENIGDIIISESGVYHITGGDKNINVTIKSGIEVEVVEVNKSTTENFVSRVDLTVENNAKVTYLVIDNNMSAYNYRNASVLEGAHLDLHVVGFNKKYNENKIEINLDEVNASGNLKLITVANNETHSIYETRINNNAKKTSADIWQKAVVKNGGSIDFLATGFIKKGADDASNYQESRVLLLDKASLGNASPLLLIDHYNVVAGHAAGVSRVSEADLYYLQSRGIDKVNAEHLMTLAFIKPLVDLISDEEIKTFVEEQIEVIIFG